MHHKIIVEQPVQRCKRFIENMLAAADRQTVAHASRAIFDQMRELAREILQTTVRAGKRWMNEFFHDKLGSG